MGGEMPTGEHHNEAFSRVLIDQALEFSGWEPGNPRQVRFEVQGGGSGRADYVLLAANGRVLAVLEAKRGDADPYDAKEQAQGYARAMTAPFIILSNGKEHWFWNHTRSDQPDAYRIERLPSRVDLERLALKNLQPPRPLLSDVVRADYVARFKTGFQLRNYQINALDTISSRFDHHRQRQFLLEMATGTGKTMLCAALIRRFLQTGNAERVLFIVDRIELARQTLEDFEVVLAEYKPVLFRTARRRPGELLGSSVVVATIQSLLVDRRYRTEFTPFFFDLVVNDEAHRSIYGDARDVVQFFQATRLGLTATPKAYLKNVDIDALRADNPLALEARQLRDTYHYFGCEPGQPTFRYDIIDAVKDPEGPFLCLPDIADLRTDITTRALADGGWAVVVNEQEESFKIQDLEQKIFTPARNRVLCDAFLEEALHDPADQIGRSIVFAVNQRHATELTRLFNERRPGVAVTITSRVPEAAVIAKDFRDGKRTERIAVSVDMLSTGYNCTDILNIGLFRPIFSPTEYIQIKGRGTRLHTFRVGTKQFQKTRFRILDFCAVAEYFEEKYDYTRPLSLPRERAGQTPPPPPSGDPTTYPPPSPNSQAVPAHDQPGQKTRETPIWEGTDALVSRAVTVVGPDGEKVDVMTFRGGYERDIREFVKGNPALQAAIEAEDDETVEAIVQQQFYHRPSRYYSDGKLILSYGVPAGTPAFVYHALGRRTLPTREAIVADTVESLAARFNLRYQEQKWLDATAQLIAEDPEARQRFVRDDITFFNANQFRTLGGLEALTRFEQREAVFAALRQSNLVRQSQLTAP